MTIVHRRNEQILFFLFLMLFSLYAGIYIYQSSFVIGGERYFCLFDDAMISMRYARNFAQGHGLVMNPGERIEGFTNPLWTLLMAGVHRFPIPQAKTSLIVQIISAVALLINLVFVRKIALIISDNSHSAAWGSVILSAFYIPLITWSLQGMEVGLLTLMMSIVVWMSLTAITRGKFPWGIYILLGLSTLVRIDMAVLFLGVLFFLAIIQREYRGKHLILGGLVFIIFLGGQTLIRFLYYGDFLPNTYYLKMTGYPLLLRITRGAVVAWQFLWHMNIFFACVPIAVLIYRYNRTRGFLSLVVGIQIAYSIFVGGDAWESLKGSNRYISIVMPQLFILIVYGLSQIKTIIDKVISKQASSLSQPSLFIVRHHFLFLVVLAFLQMNNNTSPLNLRGLLFIEPPFYRDDNKSLVERAIFLKGVTSPEAKVAVTWAGISPYFSERYTVDILGKTDRTIAHDPMRRATGFKALTYFWPGHLKYNPRYSIDEKKPDVVIQLWGDIEEYEPFMIGKYSKIGVNDKTMFLRTDSQAILWDMFEKSPLTKGK